MTLKVEETYPNGVPQTAVQNWAPPGAGWHWSAGGNGRAGWDGTVRHLISTRYTVNASYHGGFWHEHATEQTVIQWIVQTTRAAHSIAPSQVFQVNPNKDRATQEARFTEVRRILGAKSYDPNAGCIALAYAGMPADLERDLACPVFRADVQELGRQLVSHPTVTDRPHFGHGWIQPISRYEMDVATDFISLLYGEADMPVILRPVREKWKTAASADGSKGYFTTDGPGVGERKWFTTSETVESYAETADGTYRAIAYGPETLWMERGQLTPVAGTRIPTTGFGLPPLAAGTGITQAELDAAKLAAQKAGFADAKTKARVAVEAIK